MSHLKTNFNTFLNENILNISKNKKFPENYYEIYKLNKHDIGKYLNTWFEGKIVFDKKIGHLLVDEMWTVKKVDNETANHLYQYKYNPIGLWISRTYEKQLKQNDQGEDLYQMKAMICSRDDSSFGIWFNDRTIDDLKAIRLKIMEWINGRILINGEEFLQFCLTLGANKEDIDYN